MPEIHDVTYGPYSEYAAAQENAIRLQSRGKHRSIRIRDVILPPEERPATCRGGKVWFIQAVRVADGERRS